MLDKMLPNNTRFLSLATLAMEEADERRDSPPQREIRELFSEARYAWATMIDNFNYGMDEATLEVIEVLSIKEAGK